MENHPDSALYILQKLPPEKYSSDASKALFGILLFKALDKNYMPLQPDTLINFSIDYYLKQKDEKYLAIAYFYKGRKLYSQKEYAECLSLMLCSQGTFYFLFIYCLHLIRVRVLGYKKKITYKFKFK